MDQDHSNRAARALTDDGGRTERALEHYAARLMCTRRHDMSHCASQQIGMAKCSRRVRLAFGDGYHSLLALSSLVLKYGESEHSVGRSGMEHRRIAFGFVVIATVMVAAQTSSDARSSEHATAVTADVFAKIHAYNAKTLGTDFKCVSDCTQSGYQYAFCHAKCSYPDPVTPIQSAPPAWSQPHGTDYQCVNHCTQQGYQYAYCHSKCSY